MPNVLIRDLPPQVHARLVQRAKANGQSLQQYLVAELTRLSAEPTMDDILDRIERRDGARVPLDDVVADIRARRDAR